MKKKFKVSCSPEAALERISYEGQDPKKRMYVHGYEPFFNLLPVMEEGPELEKDMLNTQEVLFELSAHLKLDDRFDLPADNEFMRTIIALEEPTIVEGKDVPGAQLLVAQWGKGFTSPVHGHNTGYMHEEVLSGKIRVNTYRITDLVNKIVRPVVTTIQQEGVFVSEYAPHNADNMYEQQTLVHNFTAVEPSLSLHYLPTATKDGRGNTFTVEHFRELGADDYKRITSYEGLYLQPGDVALVRSANVPEYGDHFIIITGHPVMKEHGFRPQDHSVIASEKHTELLDSLQMVMGLTLLKLNKEVAEEFLAFHGVTQNKRELIFEEV